MLPNRIFGQSISCCARADFLKIYLLVFQRLSDFDAVNCLCIKRPARVLFYDVEMDDREAGRYWEESAEVWTGLSRRGYNIYAEHINTPALLELLPDIRGLVGVDIGCGEGATHGCWRHGARPSSRSTSPRRFCATRATRPPRSLASRPRASKLPFADAVFDFALASMSLMDMPQPALALHEAARVFKPGGFLQFSITHPCFSTPDSPQSAERRRTAVCDGDRRLLRASGDYRRVALQRRAGVGQRGSAAVPPAGIPLDAGRVDQLDRRAPACASNARSSRAPLRRPRTANRKSPTAASCLTSYTCSAGKSGRAIDTSESCRRPSPSTCSSHRRWRASTRLRDGPVVHRHLVHTREVLAAQHLDLARHHVADLPEHLRSGQVRGAVGVSQMSLIANLPVAIDASGFCPIRKSILYASAG